MGALDDAMNAANERDAAARQQRIDTAKEVKPLVDEFIALMRRRNVPTSPYFDSNRECRKFLRAPIFYQRYAYAGECWPAPGTPGTQLAVTTGGEVIGCWAQDRRYPRVDPGGTRHRYDDRAKQEFRAKRPVYVKMHEMPTQSLGHELPAAARRILGEI